MNTPAELYIEARTAGNIAVRGARDGYPCGFATVNIRPARGPFVTFLKSNNIGHKGYEGGWTLSSYDCCNFNGQNVDAKEEGCRAFNNVLQQNGITAIVESRWD